MFVCCEDLACIVQPINKEIDERVHDFVTQPLSKPLLSAESNSTCITDGPGVFNLEGPCPFLPLISLLLREVNFPSVSPTRNSSYYFLVMASPTPLWTPRSPKVPLARQQASRAAFAAQPSIQRRRTGWNDSPQPDHITNVLGGHSVDRGDQQSEHQYEHPKQNIPGVNPVNSVHQFEQGASFRDSLASRPQPFNPHAPRPPGPSLFAPSTSARYGATFGHPPQTSAAEHSRGSSEDTITHLSTTPTPSGVGLFHASRESSPHGDSPVTPLRVYRAIIDGVRTVCWKIYANIRTWLWMLLILILDPIIKTLMLIKRHHWLSDNLLVFGYMFGILPLFPFKVRIVLRASILMLEISGYGSEHVSNLFSSDRTIRWFPTDRWPYHVSPIDMGVLAVALVVQLGAFWYLGGVELREWIFGLPSARFWTLQILIWFANLFMLLSPPLKGRISAWAMNDVLGMGYI